MLVEKEKPKEKDHWLHQMVVLTLAANDLCSLLGLDDLGDAVVHFLDGLELGQAHATLVGDVVDAALGLGVLTAGSADLQVVLRGDLFETSVVGGQLWHLDVD